MKIPALMPSLSLLLVVLAGTGCEDGKNGYARRWATQEQFELALNTTDISCEDSTSQGCPGNVGLLVGIYDSGLQGSQCTAFVIGRNQVLTNSHCIPDEAAHAGADCSDLMFFVFPQANEQPAVRKRCRKVAEISEIDRTNSLSTDFTNPRADFAVVETEDLSALEPLELTQEGVRDNDAVKIYVVDPTGPTARSRISGSLKRRSCRANKQEEVLTVASGKQAPVEGGDACVFMRGNSGSPVINAAGKVPGILHATIATSDILSAILGVYQTSDRFLWSNFACVNSTVLGLTANPAICQ